MTMQGVIRMGGLPGDVSEDPVTSEKRKKSWRMSCYVGKALLILQHFCHFTYVTVHSPWAARQVN